MTTHPRGACAVDPCASLPAADEDGLITSAMARELAGGISAMTLWRWREAGVIPEPVVIRGRNYYWRNQFLAALRKAGVSPAAGEA